MRKVLLATSALVAGSAFATAAHAGAPELSLSGNLDVFFASESYDDSADGSNNFEGFSFDNASTQIHFDVDAEADNGLAYGGRVDWRTDSNSIDEIWIDLKGSFGTVVLGKDDAVGANMVVSGASALVGSGGWTGGFVGASNGKSKGRVGTAATNGYGGAMGVGEQWDTAKIAYYSPEFAGFQVGVSHSFENNRDSTTTKGITVTGGKVVDADKNGLADETTSQSNAFNGITDVAANWSGDLGAANLTVGGAYSFGGAKDQTNEDLEAYRVGAMLGVAGFTVAVGYFDNQESGLAQTSAQKGVDAGTGFTVGAGYSFGATAVSIGYITTDIQTSQTTEDTYDNLSLDVEHALAEGLTVYGGLQFAEASKGVASAADDQAESTTVVIGTSVAF